APRGPRRPRVELGVAAGGPHVPRAGAGVHRGPAAGLRAAAPARPRAPRPRRPIRGDAVAAGPVHLQLVRGRPAPLRDRRQFAKRGTMSSILTFRTESGRRARIPGPTGLPIVGALPAILREGIFEYIERCWRR